MSSFVSVPTVSGGDAHFPRVYPSVGISSSNLAQSPDSVQLAATEVSALQPPPCGVLALDSLHRTILEAVEMLSNCSDQEFGAGYRSLVALVEQAFAQEDEWMDHMDFPAAKTHREQHARILGALHNVHSRVMQGDIGQGREAALHLMPLWFDFHVSTMDAALATAMQLATIEVQDSTMRPPTPALSE